MTVRAVDQPGVPPADRNADSIKRMTPRVYAQKCGVGKDTVYAWIRRGQLPDGARAMRPTGSNRIVIEVNFSKHPDMPLLTEER